MGKGRKQSIQELQYDEASSSGSDDSDSSDEEDADELQSNDQVNSSTRKDGDEDESSGSDDNNDSSDDSTGSSADDSENEEESDDNRGPDIENKNSQDVDDASDEEEEEDSSDEEVPLQERLAKRENRGSLHRLSRDVRKSRALEEATKRLATFKQKQGKNDDGETRKPTNNSTTSKKKKNKHKPTEVSSKRADFFARGARRLNESGLGVDIGAHRYKPMDPRASSLSGHFDEDRFHKNYEFLEEMRNREIGQVRKRIAAHKATGHKGNRLRRNLGIIQADGSYSSTLEEDVALLKSLTETRANLERRKIDRVARQSVKRKIREDVESGKSGAYFLKRKEKKRLELEARFEEIRKRGGEKAVEKILAKRRQKNKSRDAGAFAK